MERREKLLAISRWLLAESKINSIDKTGYKLAAKS
jgi:hypothetical protein